MTADVLCAVKSMKHSTPRSEASHESKGMTTPRILGASFLLVFYLWQTFQQIGIWRSNPTLWSHAVTLAPYKPRVLQNYGLALLERGDTKGAIEQFRQAVKMADLPHVPAWDRRSTNRDVTANLKALRGAVRQP